MNLLKSMEKNINKILIIAPQFKAVPANSGGVEGLITDLINENEIQQRCHFFIISKKPENMLPHNFKYTSIIYNYSKSKRKNSTSKQYYFRYLVFNFFRKITYNRFTKKLLRNIDYRNFENNYFGYYCFKVASKIKPDSIILFGYDKIHHFWLLRKKYGYKTVYYHLHYCRKEELNIRQLFPNTIATSEYVFNKWNKMHLPDEKCAVIHHGIDFKKFNYNFSSNVINSKRRELGFSNTDFVVIFAGRLRPGKGVLELINAFDLISNNNIKLLILGDFDRKCVEEIEFEKNVMNKINNNNNIVHLGFIPNDQLPLFYSCANVQVVPSVYEEAAGLVALEGMLAGLPQIITKSGGMPEYVDDECSFKLPIDDNLSSNIAKFIIKLYKNPSLCKLMGKNSIKCASKYSIEDYYRNLLLFLNKE